jgi:hypothetical protein
VTGSDRSIAAATIAMPSRHESTLSKRVQPFLLRLE